MKHLFTLAALLALIPLVQTRSSAPRRGPNAGDARETSQRGWLPSLDEGLAEAAKTGKPVMVVFRCVP
jgi:hypothetical protein